MPAKAPAKEIAEKKAPAATPSKKEPAPPEDKKAPESSNAGKKATSEPPAAKGKAPAKKSEESTAVVEPHPPKAPAEKAKAPAKAVAEKKAPAATPSKKEPAPPEDKKAPESSNAGKNATSEPPAAKGKALAKGVEKKVTPIKTGTTLDLSLKAGKPSASAESSPQVLSPSKITLEDSTAGASVTETSTTTISATTAIASKAAMASPSVTGTFKLSGSSFGVLLKNPESKAKLVQAVRNDLAEVLLTTTTNIIVKSMVLGSLIVDYEVINVSEFAVSYQLAAAMEGGSLFSETSQIYTAETGATDAPTLISQTVTPQPVLTTSTTTTVKAPDVKKLQNTALNIQKAETAAATREVQSKPVPFNPVNQKEGKVVVRFLAINANPYLETKVGYINTPPYDEQCNPPSKNLPGAIDCNYNPMVEVEFPGSWPKVTAASLKQTILTLLQTDAKKVLGTLEETHEQNYFLTMVGSFDVSDDQCKKVLSDFCDASAATLAERNDLELFEYYDMDTSNADVAYSINNGLKPYCQPLKDAKEAESLKDRIVPWSEIPNSIHHEYRVQFKQPSKLFEPMTRLVPIPLHMLAKPVATFFRNTDIQKSMKKSLQRKLDSDEGCEWFGKDFKGWADSIKDWVVYEPSIEAANTNSPGEGEAIYNSDGTTTQDVDIEGDNRVMDWSSHGYRVRPQGEWGSVLEGFTWALVGKKFNPPENGLLLEDVYIPVGLQGLTTNCAGIFASLRQIQNSVTRDNSAGPDNMKADMEVSTWLLAGGAQRFDMDSYYYGILVGAGVTKVGSHWNQMVVDAGATFPLGYAPVGIYQPMNDDELYVCTTFPDSEVESMVNSLMKYMPYAKIFYSWTFNNAQDMDIKIREFMSRGGLAPRYNYLHDDKESEFSAPAEWGPGQGTLLGDDGVRYQAPKNTKAPQFLLSIIESKYESGALLNYELTLPKKENKAVTFFIYQTDMLFVELPADEYLIGSSETQEQGAYWTGTLAPGKYVVLCECEAHIKDKENSIESDLNVKGFGARLHLLELWEDRVKSSWIKNYEEKMLMASGMFQSVLDPTSNVGNAATDGAGTMETNYDEQMRYEFMSHDFFLVARLSIPSEMRIWQRQKVKKAGEHATPSYSKPLVTPDIKEGLFAKWKEIEVAKRFKKEKNLTPEKKKEIEDEMTMESFEKKYKFTLDAKKKLPDVTDSSQVKAINSFFKTCIGGKEVKNNEIENQPALSDSYLIDGIDPVEEEGTHLATYLSDALNEETKHPSLVMGISAFELAKMIGVSEYMEGHSDNLLQWVPKKVSWHVAQDDNNAIENYTLGTSGAASYIGMLEMFARRITDSCNEVSCHQEDEFDESFWKAYFTTGTTEALSNIFSKSKESAFVQTPWWKPYCPTYRTTRLQAGRQCFFSCKIPLFWTWGPSRFLLPLLMAVSDRYIANLDQKTLNGIQEAMARKSMVGLGLDTLIMKNSVTETPIPDITVEQRGTCMASIVGVGSITNFVDLNNPSELTAVDETMLELLTNTVGFDYVRHNGHNFQGDSTICNIPVRIAVAVSPKGLLAIARPMKSGDHLLNGTKWLRGEDEHLVLRQGACAIFGYGGIQLLFNWPIKQKLGPLGDFLGSWERVSLTATLGEGITKFEYVHPDLSFSPGWHVMPWNTIKEIAVSLVYESLVDIGHKSMTTRLGALRLNGVFALNMSELTSRLLGREEETVKPNVPRRGLTEATASGCNVAFQFSGLYSLRGKGIRFGGKIFEWEDFLGSQCVLKNVKIDCYWYPHEEVEGAWKKLIVYKAMMNWSYAQYPRLSFDIFGKKGLGAIEANNESNDWEVLCQLKRNVEQEVVEEVQDKSDNPDEWFTLTHIILFLLSLITDKAPKTMPSTPADWMKLKNVSFKVKYDRMILTADLRLEISISLPDCDGDFVVGPCEIHGVEIQYNMKRGIFDLSLCLPDESLGPIEIPKTGCSFRLNNIAFNLKYYCDITLVDLQDGTTGTEGWWFKTEFNKKKKIVEVTDPTERDPPFQSCHLEKGLVIPYIRKLGTKEKVKFTTQQEFDDALKANSEFNNKRAKDADGKDKVVTEKKVTIGQGTTTKLTLKGACAVGKTESIDKSALCSVFCLNQEQDNSFITITLPELPDFIPGVSFLNNFAKFKNITLSLSYKDITEDPETDMPFMLQGVSVSGVFGVSALAEFSDEEFPFFFSFSAYRKVIGIRPSGYDLIPNLLKEIGICVSSDNLTVEMYEDAVMITLKWQWAPLERFGDVKEYLLMIKVSLGLSGVAISVTVAADEKGALTAKGRHEQPNNIKISQVILAAEKKWFDKKGGFNLGFALDFRFGRYDIGDGAADIMFWISPKADPIPQAVSLELSTNSVIAKDTSNSAKGISIVDLGFLVFGQSGPLSTAMNLGVDFPELPFGGDEDFSLNRGVVSANWEDGDAEIHAIKIQSGLHIYLNATLCGNECEVKFDLDNISKPKKFGAYFSLQKPLVVYHHKKTDALIAIQGPGGTPFIIDVCCSLEKEEKTGTMKPKPERISIQGELIIFKVLRALVAVEYAKEKGYVDMTGELDLFGMCSASFEFHKQINEISFSISLGGDSKEKMKKAIEARLQQAAADASTAAAGIASSTQVTSAAFAAAGKLIQDSTFELAKEIELSTAKLHENTIEAQNEAASLNKYIQDRIYELPAGKAASALAISDEGIQQLVHKIQSTIDKAQEAVAFAEQTRDALTKAAKDMIETLSVDFKNKIVDIVDSLGDTIVKWQDLINALKSAKSEFDKHEYKDDRFHIGSTTSENNRLYLEARDSYHDAKDTLTQAINPYSSQVEGVGTYHDAAFNFCGETFASKLGTSSSGYQPVMTLLKAAKTTANFFVSNITQIEQQISDVKTAVQTWGADLKATEISIDENSLDAMVKSLTKNFEDTINSQQKAIKELDETKELLDGLELETLRDLETDLAEMGECFAESIDEMKTAAQHDLEMLCLTEKVAAQQSIVNAIIISHKLAQNTFDELEKVRLQKMGTGPDIKRATDHALDYYQCLNQIEQLEALIKLLGGVSSYQELVDKKGQLLADQYNQSLPRMMPYWLSKVVVGQREAMYERFQAKGMNYFFKPAELYQVAQDPDAIQNYAIVRPPEPLIFDDVQTVKIDQGLAMQSVLKKFVPYKWIRIGDSGPTHLYLNRQYYGVTYHQDGSWHDSYFTNVYQATQTYDDIDTGMTRVLWNFSTNEHLKRWHYNSEWEGNLDSQIEYMKCKIYQKTAVGCDLSTIWTKYYGVTYHQDGSWHDSYFTKVDEAIKTYDAVDTGMTRVLWNFSMNEHLKRWHFNSEWKGYLDSQIKTIKNKRVLLNVDYSTGLLTNNSKGIILVGKILWKAYNHHSVTALKDGKQQEVFYQCSPGIDSWTFKRSFPVRNIFYVIWGGKLPSTAEKFEKYSTYEAALSAYQYLSQDRFRAIMDESGNILESISSDLLPGLIKFFDANGLRCDTNGAEHSRGADIAITHYEAVATNKTPIPVLPDDLDLRAVQIGKGFAEGDPKTVIATLKMNQLQPQQVTPLQLCTLAESGKEIKYELNLEWTPSALSRDRNAEKFSVALQQVEYDSTLERIVPKLESQLTAKSGVFEVPAWKFHAGPDAQAWDQNMKANTEKVQAAVKKFQSMFDSEVAAIEEAQGQFIRAQEKMINWVKSTGGNRTELRDPQSRSNETLLREHLEIAKNDLIRKRQYLQDITQKTKIGMFSEASKEKAKELTTILEEAENKLAGVATRYCRVEAPKSNVVRLQDVRVATSGFLNHIVRKQLSQDSFCLFFDSLGHIVTTADTLPLISKHLPPHIESVMLAAALRKFVDDEELGEEETAKDDEDALPKYSFIVSYYRAGNFDMKNFATKSMAAKFAEQISAQIPTAVAIVTMDISGTFYSDLSTHTLAQFDMCCALLAKQNVEPVSASFTVSFMKKTAEGQENIFETEKYPTLGGAKKSLSHKYRGCIVDSHGNVRVWHRLDESSGPIETSPEDRTLFINALRQQFDQHEFNVGEESSFASIGDAMKNLKFSSVENPILSISARENNVQDGTGAENIIKFPFVPGACGNRLALPFATSSVVHHAFAITFGGLHRVLEGHVAFGVIQRALSLLNFTFSVTRSVTEAAVTGKSLLATSPNAQMWTVAAKKFYLTKHQTATKAIADIRQKCVDLNRTERELQALSEGSGDQAKTNELVALQDSLMKQDLPARTLVERTKASCFRDIYDSILTGERHLWCLLSKTWSARAEAQVSSYSYWEVPKDSLRFKITEKNCNVAFVFASVGIAKGTSFVEINVPDCFGREREMYRSKGSESLLDGHLTILHYHQYQEATYIIRALVKGLRLLAVLVDKLAIIPPVNPGRVAAVKTLKDGNWFTQGMGFSGFVLAADSKISDDGMKTQFSIRAPYGLPDGLQVVDRRADSCASVAGFQSLSPLDSLASSFTTGKQVYRASGLSLSVQVTVPEKECRKVSLYIPQRGNSRKVSVVAESTPYYANLNPSALISGAIYTFTHNRAKYGKKRGLTYNPSTGAVTVSEAPTPFRAVRSKNNGFVLIPTNASMKRLSDQGVVTASEARATFPSGIPFFECIRFTWLFEAVDEKKSVYYLHCGSRNGQVLRGGETGVRTETFQRGSCLGEQTWHVQLVSTQHELQDGASYALHTAVKQQGLRSTAINDITVTALATENGRWVLMNQENKFLNFPVNKQNLLGGLVKLQFDDLTTTPQALFLKFKRVYTTPVEGFVPCGFHGQFGRGSVESNDSKIVPRAMLDSSDQWTYTEMFEAELYPKLRYVGDKLDAESQTVYNNWRWFDGNSTCWRLKLVDAPQHAPFNKEITCASISQQTVTAAHAYVRFMQTGGTVNYTVKHDTIAVSSNELISPKLSGVFFDTAHEADVVKNEKSAEFLSRWREHVQSGMYSQETAVVSQDLVTGPKWLGKYGSIGFQMYSEAPSKYVHLGNMKTTPYTFELDSVAKNAPGVPLTTPCKAWPAKGFSIEMRGNAESNSKISFLCRGQVNIIAEVGGEKWAEQSSDLTDVKQNSFVQFYHQRNVVYTASGPGYIGGFFFDTAPDVQIGELCEPKPSEALVAPRLQYGNDITVLAQSDMQLLPTTMRFETAPIFVLGETLNGEALSIEQDKADAKINSLEHQFPQFICHRSNGTFSAELLLHSAIQDAIDVRKMNPKMQCLVTNQMGTVIGYTGGVSSTCESLDPKTETVTLSTLLDAYRQVSKLPIHESAIVLDTFSRRRWYRGSRLHANWETSLTVAAMDNAPETVWKLEGIEYAVAADCHGTISFPSKAQPTETVNYVALSSEKEDQWMNGWVGAVFEDSTVSPKKVYFLYDHQLHAVSASVIGKYYQPHKVATVYQLTKGVASSFFKVGKPFPEWTNLTLRDGKLFMKTVNNWMRELFNAPFDVTSLPNQPASTKLPFPIAETGVDTRVFSNLRNAISHFLELPDLFADAVMIGSDELDFPGMQRSCEALMNETTSERTRAEMGILYRRAVAAVTTRRSLILYINESEGFVRQQIYKKRTDGNEAWSKLLEEKDSLIAALFVIIGPRKAPEVIDFFDATPITMAFSEVPIDVLSAQPVLNFHIDPATGEVVEDSNGPENTDSLKIAAADRIELLNSFEHQKLDGCEPFLQHRLRDEFNFEEGLLQDRYHRMLRDRAATLSATLFNNLLHADSLAPSQELRNQMATALACEATEEIASSSARASKKLATTLTNQVVGSKSIGGVKTVPHESVREREFLLHEVEHFNVSSSHLLRCDKALLTLRNHINKWKRKGLPWELPPQWQQVEHRYWNTRTQQWYINKQTVYHGYTEDECERMNDLIEFWQKLPSQEIPQAFRSVVPAGVGRATTDIKMGYTARIARFTSTVTQKRPTSDKMQRLVHSLKFCLPSLSTKETSLWQTDAFGEFDNEGTFFIRFADKKQHAALSANEHRACFSIHPLSDPTMALSADIASKTVKLKPFSAGELHQMWFHEEFSHHRIISAKLPDNKENVFVLQCPDNSAVVLREMHKKGEELAPDPAIHFDVLPTAPILYHFHRVHEAARNISHIVKFSPMTMPGVKVNDCLYMQALKAQPLLRRLVRYGARQAKDVFEITFASLLRIADDFQKAAQSPVAEIQTQCERYWNSFQWPSSNKYCTKDAVNMLWMTPKQYQKNQYQSGTPFSPSNPPPRHFTEMLAWLVEQERVRKGIAGPKHLKAKQRVGETKWNIAPAEKELSICKHEKEDVMKQFNADRSARASAYLIEKEELKSKIKAENEKQFGTFDSNGERMDFRALLERSLADVARLEGTMESANQARAQMKQTVMLKLMEVHQYANGNEEALQREMEAASAEQKMLAEKMSTETSNLVAAVTELNELQDENGSWDIQLDIGARISWGTSITDPLQVEGNFRAKLISPEFLGQKIEVEIGPAKVDSISILLEKIKNLHTEVLDKIL